MKNIKRFMWMALTLVHTCVVIPVHAQLSPSVQQSVPTNYVTQGGFENGIATWKAYKNTAQATPVTGSGGSPTTTVGVTTTNPLFGKASGLLTHPAANVQGEGISIPFTIDPGARGKVLTISTTYQIASGTYSGGTSSTDSDVEVYIYNVDTSTLIQPGGYKLDGGVIGYNYQINATFQTDTTSTNYRLIYHVATSTATAFSLKLDGISVALSAKPIGVVNQANTVSILSGSGTYTPPVGVYMLRVRMVGGGGGGGDGAGTNNGGSGGSTTFTGTGASLSAFGGTGGSGSQSSTGGSASGCDINLTGGSSIGGSATGGGIGSSGGNSVFGGGASGGVAGGGGAAAPAGTGGGGGSGNSGSHENGGGGAGGYCEKTLSSIAASYTYSVGSGGSASAGSPAGGAGGSGTIIVEEFYYGKNVQFSADTDTRVVAFAANTSAGQSITSSLANISFASSVTDTHSGFNGTTTYTIPVAGYYDLSAMTYPNPGSATAGTAFLQIQKNGANQLSSGVATGVPSAGQIYSLAGRIDAVLCKAGDIITVQMSQNTGSTMTATGTFSVVRRSGPSQIASTETVKVRAFSTAGTGYNNGPTTYAYAQKDYDSHGAFSSNTFTAPAPGTYSICAKTRLAGTITGLQEARLFARKNASTLYSLNNVVGNGSNMNYGIYGCAQLQLVAGDTLDIRITTNTGGTLSESGSTGENSVEILRVGN